MTNEDRRNKYYLSVNLQISSIDGSQGQLSTNFNKMIQANSISDIIKILQAFDSTTDQLQEMVKDFTVDE